LKLLFKMFQTLLLYPETFESQNPAYVHFFFCPCAAVYCIPICTEMIRALSTQK
jgi:hypothetical protein